MLGGQDHDLEWPSSPPRTHHEECVILPDNTLFLFFLQLGIIKQQVTAILRLVVFLQLLQLARRLFRQRGSGPDLPVRVWIRATHGCTLVFENLHPSVLVLRLFNFWMRVRGRHVFCKLPEGWLGRQVSSVNRCPGPDYRHNLFWAHVGERNVVGCTERQHVAFALDWLGLQEETRKTTRLVRGIVVILCFLDGTVVIDEDEGIFVLRIGVAGCSFVAGAQVAFWIILGQLNQTGAFLCTLPGSFRSVWWH